MNIPLPLKIGLRYTRAKRRNHFISFISATSIAGIVLGVWALITVMSIMNGFHHDLRDRILFVVSHVTISGDGGALSDWQNTAAKIQGHRGVKNSAPYILGQAMLTQSGATTGALIRGIRPQLEGEVSQVLQHLTAGSADALMSGGFGIILGESLAYKLGLVVGDRVTLVTPAGRSTPVGFVPRLRRLNVVGLFRVDMHQYDSGIAFMHIDDAAKLFSFGNSVSGLRLKLSDADLAQRVRRELSAELGGGFVVRDWTLEHSNFFRALEIEKRVVFIVLLLIIAVAAFNIVSTLVMIVTDKKSDIAVLRTLGMSPRAVMQIFMVQGTLIGIAGIVVGGALGVLTALNVDTLIPALENLFNTKLFPVDVYVITDFPAQMRWADVGRVIGAAMFMSFVATLYPAWKAANVNPAEALRYE